MQTIYTGRAHGKLLLTAEYLVLDNTPAIALPTQYGQSIEVASFISDHKKVICTSLDKNNEAWFGGEFDMEAMSIVSSTDEKIARRFLSLLQFIHTEKPSVFEQTGGIQIKNKIDFDRQWGLGTSSTLIHNLATWSGVDAYAMLEHSFGGSGYDLACAAADTPILYQRDSPAPRYSSVSFRPDFKDQIYFVYLGKKQNSREGIQNYRALSLEDKLPHAIAEVKELNENILAAKSLSLFEESLEEHEEIISNLIGMPKVKDLYFSDHMGAAKSLGAWGGDFVLLTHQGRFADLKTYCQLKGFDVVIPYKEMIL